MFYERERERGIQTPLWSVFKIGDIFFTPKIKKYSKIPCDPGPTPFISSQSINNGIATFCNLKPEIKNCITISTNGNNFDCFYHDYYIVPSCDVEVIKNNNLNKFNSIFICSILNLESKKYSFGKKAKNGAVQNTVIYLPVDDIGNPDWNYMENYIKSLPYSKYL